MNTIFSVLIALAGFSAHANEAALICQDEARASAQVLADSAKDIVVGLKALQLSESNGEYYRFQMPSPLGRYEIEVNVRVVSGICFIRNAAWTVSPVN